MCENHRGHLPSQLVQDAGGSPMGLKVRHKTNKHTADEADAPRRSAADCGAGTESTACVQREREESHCVLLWKLLTVPVTITKGWGTQRHRVTNHTFGKWNSPDSEVQNDILSFLARLFTWDQIRRGRRVLSSTSCNSKMEVSPSPRGPPITATISLDEHQSGSAHWGRSDWL